MQLMSKDVPFPTAEPLVWHVRKAGYEFLDSNGFSGYSLGHALPWTLGFGSSSAAMPDVNRTVPCGKLIAAVLPTKEESASESGLFHAYDPLRSNALADLLETEESEEGLLSFVTEYGRFGCDEYLIYETDNSSGRHQTVEPVERCLAEIVRIKLIVSFIEAAKKGPSRRDEAVTTLRQILNLPGGHSSRETVIGEGLIKASWYEASPARMAFKKLYAGNYAQFQMVEPRLDEGQLLQRLALNYATEQINLELLRGASPFLSFNRKTTNLAAIPRYLLAAMYLQIALERVGMRGLRMCEVCGKPLPLDSKAKTCSTACRQRKKYWKDRENI